MFTVTTQTKIPTVQTNFERQDVFAQFVDRANEARMKSQLLTLPFTF